MKATTLLLGICLLVALVSPYAIEGDWQSSHYPDARITLSPLFTHQDRLNQYSLAVSGCPQSYQFKIVESFIKMTGIPSSGQLPTCTSANAASLNR